MKKLSKSKIREFSKRILVAMTFMWFVGALYGMTVEIIILSVAPEMFSIDGVLTYIGTPITCGLMTYLIKSALENKEKIKQKYDPKYGQDEVEITEVSDDE